MVTRRTKAVEAEMPDEAMHNAIALLEDDTFNAESLNPALESLYAEMGMTEGGEATVHVTKLNSNGHGTEANIWRGPPDDYDLERLAKQFGSGDYRVKIYARIPSGQKVLKANKVFSWLLSPEEESRRESVRNGNILQPAPQMNPSDLVRSIVEAIKVAVPPPITTQPIDPMEQMKKFAEIMALMRPEPVHAPSSDPLSGMKNLVEMMTLMKELQGEPRLPENAGTNDVLLGLIDKFGPVMLQAMATQGAASNMKAPQIAHRPAAPVTSAQMPTATTVSQNPQPIQKTEEDAVNIKLKMGLSFLVSQCDAGGMPETYAEVVIDTVPESELQMLLDSPNTIDLLAQIDARISQPPRREWFERLMESCKELLSPMESEDGEERAQNEQNP